MTMRFSAGHLAVAFTLMALFDAVFVAYGIDFGVATPETVIAYVAPALMFWAIWAGEKVKR